MPLSPTQTRHLLEAIEHRPRKQLGQNFLIDGNIVRKSIQLAALESGDHVVEIGPGLGTLTEAMLSAGCHVHAIELDPTLADHLLNSLKPSYPETFSLMEGDAVSHPIADLDAASGPFKIVANLPYAITSPWLEAVLSGSLPTDLVLMMQKEAADRILAEPGSKAFGGISIFTTAAYQKASIHAVSRNCFYPVPGVDSILLHLKRKSTPVAFKPATKETIRKIFTQRRKQIGTLTGQIEELQPWLNTLSAFGCDRKSRPEDIPVEAWLAMNDLPVN